MKRKATLGAWLVSSLLLTLMPCFGQQTNLKSAPTPKAATANYGKLPLLFERNQGQTDPRDHGDVAAPEDRVELNAPGHAQKDHQKQRKIIIKYHDAPPNSARRSW